MALAAIRESGHQTQLLHLAPPPIRNTATLTVSGWPPRAAARRRQNFGAGESGLRRKRAPREACQLMHRLFQKLASPRTISWSNDTHEHFSQSKCQRIPLRRNAVYQKKSASGILQFMKSNEKIPRRAGATQTESLTKSL